MWFINVLIWAFLINIVLFTGFSLFLLLGRFDNQILDKIVIFLFISLPITAVLATAALSNKYHRYNEVIFVGRNAYIGCVDNKQQLVLLHGEVVIDPIRLQSESNVLGQSCSEKTYSYEEKLIGEKSVKNS